jgi:phosphatidate cytidylyltransferase
VVSGIIGLLIVYVILYFLNSLFFNFVVALICVIGVCELSKIVLGKFSALQCICCLTAIFIPLWKYLEHVLVLMLLMLFCLCLCLFFERKKIAISNGLFVFAMAVGISLSFSCVIFVRDILPTKHNEGLLVIVVLFASAWLTDIFAFFVGSVCGKHKLAEDVSPKKTKEGVAGGICFSVVCCVLFAFYAIKSCLVCGCGYISTTQLLVFLVVIFLIASALAVFGDLFMSLVKRQFGVKDFGRIMPGHGGVLDRLDSLIFVAPYFFVLVSVLGQ